MTYEEYKEKEKIKETNRLNLKIVDVDEIGAEFLIKMWNYHIYKYGFVSCANLKDFISMIDGTLFEYELTDYIYGWVSKIDLEKDFVPITSRGKQKFYVLRIKES